MKKNNLNRTYNLTDAALCLSVLEKAMFMKRDLHAFSAFGIDLAKINAFEVEADLFSGTETDVEPEANNKVPQY